MEIEQLELLDTVRAELSQQHEEVTLTLKEDLNCQITQQQQLISVSRQLPVCHLQHGILGTCDDGSDIGCNVVSKNNICHEANCVTMTS